MVFMVGEFLPLFSFVVVLVVDFLQAFNMFIASVYYYLIPDVVRDHQGRFYGLFRICGALAGVFFNYFVFGLAETHFEKIFSITAGCLSASGDFHDVLEGERRRISSARLMRGVGAGGISSISLGFYTEAVFWSSDQLGLIFLAYSSSLP